jgi:hypothetical protein
MILGGVMENEIESPELAEVNRQIAEIRENKNNPLHDRFWKNEDKVVEHVQNLYKKKVELMKKAKPEDEGTCEAKHEYEDEDDEASEPGEDKQTDQEIKNVENQVEDSLRNSFGGRFDSNMEAMGEIVREVFQTEQNFTEWLSETGLAVDPAAQIETAHLLAEIAGPVSREMSIESCRDAVEKNLIEIWGDRAKENMAAAQQAARQIFGSIELADQFFIDRGWGENPRMQVAAMRLLARLARRIPTV